jgi:hypothetical protein
MTLPGGHLQDLSPSPFYPSKKTSTTLLSGMFLYYSFRICDYSSIFLYFGTSVFMIDQAIK